MTRYSVLLIKIVIGAAAVPVSPAITRSSRFPSYYRNGYLSADLMPKIVFPKASDTAVSLTIILCALNPQKTD